MFEMTGLRASPDPPAAWYRYTPTREGAHPRAHLAKFKGVLQADAFAGFNGLYESGAIREVACWAHARRKFYDLYETTKSPIAAEALDPHPGAVCRRGPGPRPAAG